MLWLKSKPKPHPKPRPQISFLVPFRDDGEHRKKVWEWLDRYWGAHFPDAEIIIGHDGGHPFSKATAVNNAAQRASGRIFVVLDADCLMDSAIVQSCADKIDAAVAQGKRLWFVPYLYLYRLTQHATKLVLRSDPAAPFDIPTPPLPGWVEPGGPNYGHQYGALILMMPASAFHLVGGMDPRFRGWGSEDAAFMRSLDTLYALHQTTNNEVLHMWHVRPGNNYLTRKWEGQRMTNVNSRLGQRYGLASGDPTLMRALVDERDRSSYEPRG